tara:strand:+ start:478 stop:633 length:156 start_codon:yes stop_codon:yes gene_type:complete
MTSNFQEFIGMASFVSAATFFVVGLRWAILKMGCSFEQPSESETNTTEVKV